MNSRWVSRAVVSWAALLALGGGELSAQNLDAITGEQAAANKAAAATQERVDKLDDETSAMLARYRQALADTESFRKYNEQLATQVASQGEELAGLKRQLAEIEVTSREILPLMVRMVDALEKLVALDLPFLPEERAARVATVKSLLPRADVTLSEKYRRILEAYQIELEYGRTLEAYEGKIDGGKTVELVRLGRVSLMYRTLDGNETGYWDHEAKAWVADAHYAHAVREALRVAKKLGAPDLLIAPVPAPKRAAP